MKSGAVRCFRAGPVSPVRANDGVSFSSSLILVRRDWREEGTHDLLGPHGSEEEALRWILRDIDRLLGVYPTEPTHSVVRSSWTIFSEHRHQRCRHRFCPTARPTSPPGGILLDFDDEEVV